LASAPRILPQVNQIEVHPFNTRTDITQFCAAHDIVVEAYAPLVRALRMQHPLIVKLADKYACSASQLLVRWSLQHGFVPLPKSVQQARIVENADIGGFAIAADDMAAMDALDEYLVTGECYPPSETEDTTLGTVGSTHANWQTGIRRTVRDVRDARDARDAP
jgi:diketogulonate reductase-like aldo/keto reductase